MPTYDDETLHDRYAREHADHMARLAKMKPEQIAEMELSLHNALAEIDQLHAQLPSQGGEAVEVVAWALEHPEAGYKVYKQFSQWMVDGEWECRPLMTVAQHQRIMAASVGSAEPACYQFKGRDGEWYPFMDDRHYKATLESGEWPIRALYTHPADQVAEPWTKAVPVELLELIDEAMCDFLGEDDPVREQLRALLADSGGVKK